MFFFFQAEDGIRDLVRSRGLGDVYKRQVFDEVFVTVQPAVDLLSIDFETEKPLQLGRTGQSLSLIHI